jgi:hypothetical protein
VNLLPIVNIHAAWNFSVRVPTWSGRGPALPLVTVTADRFGILGGASHQALDLRGIGIASEITSCQSFSNARDSSGGIFLCGMRAPT